MVTVIARKALDITKLNFGRFFDGEHAYASNQTIKFDYPDTNERDRFLGNFSFSGSTVSGTANKWAHTNYKTGKTFFAFTGMNLSANAVIAAAKTNKVGDDKAIIQKMLGGDDKITGSKSVDKLLGYGGNDTISGGGGIDKLDGGAGVHDQASFSTNFKPVQVTLAGSSFATVKIGGVDQDLIKNFEDFAGGKGNDLITGDANGNLLIGNGGDDVLIGLGGKDYLIGNEGNDLLLGGALHDTLEGGGQNDTLIGGAGKDSMSGGKHNDLLQGNGGGDLLSGDTGSDTLEGGGNNDTLSGGKGDDRLTGGTGKDVQSGNAGADTFVFLAIDDSTTSLAGRDLITDFQRNTDRIDLSAIDAITSTLGLDDAFKLVKKGANANVSEGQIGWYKVDLAGTANDRTYLRVNNDSDGEIEMTIELQGAINLTKVDFIL